MNSIKVESSQASAVVLGRAARGVGRLGTTHACFTKILKILFNVLHQQAAHLPSGPADLTRKNKKFEFDSLRTM
jgi:hypothetical protein